MINKIVGFLFVLIFAELSYANTIQVCLDCKIDSIEEALMRAENGDTILVAPAVYTVGNIVIDKSIYLKGKGKPTLFSAEGDEIITVLADNVTIDGFRIEGVTTSYLKERSGIRVKEARNFNIINNEVIDCFFGIYLEHSKRGKVMDNMISGNATTEAESGNGIHAWYSDNIEIIGNQVIGHRDGIYFEFVNKSNVINNRSEKNKRYGLHFMFSNDDNYRQNTFKNNGVGVAVMFSRRIEMVENIFSYNWGRSSYGLLLKEIYDAEIHDNIYEQNTVGIFVEGSNRIVYKYNTFKRNGWAIKFSGGCEDNEIIYNNFLDNSLDLVVNTKLASNKFHHNYWSSYSGYDLDKDNIGDIPHFPVKLFSFVLEQAPEAIVLMRSLFVEIINYAEKVSPVFTPKEVKDDFPLMTRYNAEN